MKKAIFLSFVIVSLIGISTAAGARTYVRWCNASFRIVPFALGLQAPRDNVYTETFRARASGGWYIPNTIRTRAYRKARDCINSLWDSPGSGSVNGVPAQCTNNGGNGIYGFNPTPTFLEDIRNRACRAWGPEYRGRTVPVRIIGNVWGNNGCGGSVFDKNAVIYPRAGTHFWWRPSSLNSPPADGFFYLSIPSRCN
jgi:hypothetical protein